MEKIAIVGSGISGLGCAWFLHRHHEVTVFEADSHIGGHSNTIEVPEGDGVAVMDTGFMVYNEVTYPHLTRLFQELSVPTQETTMSFSVHHAPSGVEWNGGGFNTLFAQRKNLLNLRHWRFLWQLNRFNTEAVAALDEPRFRAMTLDEYVTARGYGADFLERYLVPMAGAVWSAPPNKVLQFPAMTLLRFWHNHGFLGLSTHHQWRTVQGGSREYVHRMIAPFKERIRLQTPVQNVRRRADKVEVTTSRQGTESFDRIIFASHADQSLRLLVDATKTEVDVLSAFRYQPNKTQVHSNSKIMPNSKRCWAAWNYRHDRRSADFGGAHADSSTPSATSTHYWMNALQGVSERVNYFVSLNAQISEGDVLREIDYEHPLFDLRAIDAQSQIQALNDPGSGTKTHFIGAWTRYGFHEDGLLSAVNLCQQLMGADPWLMR